ncbi:hypothetical protein OF83DRAFT_1071555 [Amylostereum chailletii]|nr:hypothetical protein OF83DRAFT_1071555 [Amylostereum chailletii]
MNIVIHGFAYLSLLICVHFPFCRAQQTFFPSSVPLFFRTPYVYAYIPTTSGTIHSHEWPRITGPVSALGWTGLIKVDNGTTYLWSGNTGTMPGTNDTAVKYFTVTPTRTIFTIEAGPLELNITYLSPIEPDDFVKQSIPFAYLTFEARSTDGSPHHMQVYTGITGGESPSSLLHKSLNDQIETEWLSWDHSQNQTWATTPTTNGSQIHSYGYATPQEFNELQGMASWGTPYYATRQGTGVTYRIGLTEPNPALFIAQGFLDNSVDPGAPRTILSARSPRPQWTSLTFAHDLGIIESTSAPVVWAFGHTFDSDNTSAIQYQDLSGNPPQRRSLYYVTEYSDDHTLIDDFLNDFPAALERAIKLDANLTNAAASTIPGTEYSDLVALATRQALGFTSLTIAKGSDVRFAFSLRMRFAQNQILSQVNPPDGLYSSFPMYLYLNPSFGAPLLEPLLRFQASPAYTKSIPYAAANIGTSWPNMTASNSSHHQGVERKSAPCSANMIILSYAQARAAGDTSLVDRYYHLLRSWTDYLVNTTLFTPSTIAISAIQVSADGLNIANQTNLAIKGIIAIKAMSMIASLTGKTADATAYSEKSRDIFTQWKAHALAADDRHMLLAYDDDDSSNYSLGYNVFADLWLGTGVVDSDVTNGLSNQANKLLSSPVIQPGLPTDSTVTDRVQSAWNMFIAAAVNNSATRSRIISRVHDRISLNTTDDQLYPLTWRSSSFSTIFGDTTYDFPLP